LYLQKLEKRQKLIEENTPKTKQNFMINMGVEEMVRESINSPLIEKGWNNKNTGLEFY
jgi:hypothetical protein